MPTLPPPILRPGRAIIASISGYLLLMVPLLAAPLWAQPPSPLGLDPARLPQGAWTYSLRIGDHEAGTLEAETRRSGSTLVSSVYTQTADIQQTTVTVEAATLRPLTSSVIMLGHEGARFSAQITYRAQGDTLSLHRRILAQADTSAGRLPAEHVRTEAADGTFDLAQLDLVIAALPLAAGAVWDFQLVDPTVDRSIPVRVRIEGARTVEVPAGRFQVWRAVVTGLALETHYDIDRDGRFPVAQYIPAQRVAVLLTRVRPG